jgi:hypothetical protein
MARWVLVCPECKQDFTQSEIPSGWNGGGRLDPFIGYLVKPEFPPSGLKMECPNCKKASLFQRYQLTYGV